VPFGDYLLERALGVAVHVAHEISGTLHLPTHRAEMHGGASDDVRGTHGGRDAGREQHAAFRV
jgi:hypothetical protein